MDRLRPTGGEIVKSVPSATAAKLAHACDSAATATRFFGDDLKLRLRKILRENDDFALQQKPRWRSGNR